MNENKSFWRTFNPSLKEMMEEHPHYSVLGLWWSFTWRIWVVSAIVMTAFVILVLVFGVALNR
jgi:hypothetical protein